MNKKEWFHREEVRALLRKVITERRQGVPSGTNPVSYHDRMRKKYERTDPAKAKQHARLKVKAQSDKKIAQYRQNDPK